MVSELVTIFGQCGNGNTVEGLHGYAASRNGGAGPVLLPIHIMGGLVVQTGMRPPSFIEIDPAETQCFFVLTQGSTLFSTMPAYCANKKQGNSCEHECRTHKRLRVAE